MESRLQIPEPRPMRPVFREALKRRLSQSSSHVGRTWRFSFPVGLAIISAVFGGAVATAAIYEQFRPVSNLNSAHCFSIASSETSGTQIAEAGPLTSPQQVTDAVGACSVLWRDGFLVLGTSHIIRVTQPTTVHPIPPLVVCTMPDGTAGVFPGKQTLCKKLGLPLANQ
jgi:hypothetical protein